MFNRIKEFFSRLFSSTKKQDQLPNFYGKYSKNMKKSEKQSLLMGNNMMYEDMEKLINTDNLPRAVEQFVQNGFKPLDEFYKNWKNLEDIVNILPAEKNIIYFFGNNGVGKTTSIVNLALKLKKYNKKICIIAADEFRGGAVEQLVQMTKKNDIDCYSSKQYDKEVSIFQLLFDSLKDSLNKDYDVILIDTAGRSHQDINLTDNLKKQYSVSEKLLSSDEVKNKNSVSIQSIWVNDSNIVNSFQDQKTFLEKIPANYIIVTKTKENCGYYNLIYMMQTIKAPIIFYSPTNKELEFFNEESFTKHLG